MTSVKMYTSKFIEQYRQNLEAWAKKLIEQRGQTIGISRKGPRLFALLVREGLLPHDFFNSVITELALPFLDTPYESLTIADDGVWWGSTFNRVSKLANIANLLCHGRGDIRGLPFAMSKGCDAERLIIDTKYFLSLDKGQVSAFVNNEVSAFRLLGHPFDIEHPSISFAGCFDDAHRVASIIEDVAFRLGGKCIDVSSIVPSAQGTLTALAWTILLNTEAFSAGIRPQLVKLRIYLDAERQTLTVVAMQPLAVTCQDVEQMADYLPKSLGTLWHTVVDPVRAKSSIDNVINDVFENGAALWRDATEHSIVMWAAFLNAMPLLRASKDIFSKVFSDQEILTEVEGPREDDLRLLIGPKYVKESQKVLADFISSADAVNSLMNQLPNRGGTEDFEDAVPDQYRNEYPDKRSSMLKTASSDGNGDVDSVVRAVFHSQHIFIELPSRQNIDSDTRLDFGISLGKLCELVLQWIPDAKGEEIHRSLDRLIDEGCIVPRYLQRPNSQGAPVWIRMFRVGEGPVEKLIHTVRVLFDKFSKALGAESIPKLHFEKFCVLILSNISGKSELNVLASLNTYKKFHLYGARQALTVGHQVSFLLDWAQEQKILSSSEHDDEKHGEYVLNKGLEVLYRQDECPWDDYTQDAIEDVAKFAVKVLKEKGLGSDALILLTSVATQAELKSAIEAELDLWLHDQRFSVYHALQALGEFARVVPWQQPSIEALNQANDVMWRMANFSAQVKKKMDLDKERSNIHSKLGALVNGDTITARIWRGISQTFDSRMSRESEPPSFNHIRSALRVAYVTTRVLRDLLAHAGYVDSHGRAEPIKKSIELFRNRINDAQTIDPIVQRFLAGSDGDSSVDAIAEEAMAGLPCAFPEAFNLIRPLILHVAERCEEILRMYRSEEFREKKESLYPPQYILMWDIRGSTDAKNRKKLEQLIEKANSQLRTMLKENAKDFRPESRDDGNGMVCSTFEHVLAAFQILTDVYDTGGENFRAGVEVNMQGQLDYYPEYKALGGRAFEHAARITSLFKEIKGDSCRWVGDVVPIEPENMSYLVVGEFARRFAEMEKVWPPKGLVVESYSGQYAARVHGAIPIKINLVLSRSRQ